MADHNEKATQPELTNEALRRREALKKLAQHSAYATPAILLLMSQRAAAASGGE